MIFYACRKCHVSIRFTCPGLISTKYGKTSRFSNKSRKCQLLSLDDITKYHSMEPQPCAGEPKSGVPTPLPLRGEPHQRYHYISRRYSMSTPRLDHTTCCWVDGFPMLLENTKSDFSVVVILQQRLVWQARVCWRVWWTSREAAVDILHDRWHLRVPTPVDRS